jgi:hypothetical protein
MLVDVVQDVVVTGLYLDVLDECFLNYGEQEATEVVHVHVTDVITIKAQAAVHIILK